MLSAVGAAEGCDLLIFLKARSKDRSLRQLLQFKCFVDVTLGKIFALYTQPSSSLADIAIRRAQQF
jgi:hypothetical protein